MEQGVVTSMESQGGILALFTDRKGVISQSNKAFAERFGYHQEKLQTMAVNELLHGDVPTVILASILSAMRQGKVWMGLLKLSSPTESAYWSQVTVAPVAGQRGNFLWTFSSASDAQVALEETRYAQLRNGDSSLKKGFFRRKLQWLRDLPLGYKLGASITLLTVVVVFTLMMNELRIMRTVIAEEEQQTLDRYSGMVSLSIKDTETQVATLATLVAEMPLTREALLRRDRRALLAAFEKPFAVLKKRYGIRQFEFDLAPATSFLRVHQPAKHGDDLSGFRKTVVAANKRSQLVTGLEKGRSGYGILGVVPIVIDGANIGSVEFEKSLGQEFFNRFKSKHHVDVALMTLEGGKPGILGSTFGRYEPFSEQELRQVLSGADLYKSLLLDGKTHAAYARALNDYSGNPVGVLVTALDSTPYQKHFSHVRNQVLMLGSIAVFLSMLVSYFLARVLSRPVQEASTVAGRIANGFYNNDVTLNSDDETGKLLNSMAAMQAILGYNLHEAGERAEENARIKIALDYIFANVTVSDSNGDLIFMNNACMSLFDRLAKTQTDNASFHATDLLGTRLVDFFADDELKAIYGKPLREPETVFYAIWGHEFKLYVSPVYDENGDYQGRVTQWVDITDEVTVQREIQGIVSAAESGDLSQRISLNEKEGFFLELASGINLLIESVDQIIDDIATAMKHVADGDLTRPISKEYRGTFGVVRNSVNETIGTLEKMVAELRNASIEISDSSNEITSGNDELSHRTEQQASSLETTAASMEEITGTVNQNSVNAQEATTLAEDAQAISQEGVGVVQNLIKAMDTINESSSKIEQIIHVIDEIAFQTNLLALNAAVEAARAGEQGRGFAVVASEVRDLAGRSSDAAKQIKTLISASVERVTNGTELVHNAGETLDVIAGSISKVSTIMGEIAHANQEQAVGIQQVNHSITKIDEATQQNTALAEQTSAVAISLKNQSRELDEMIQKFVISEASGEPDKQGFLHAV